MSPCLFELQSSQLAQVRGAGAGPSSMGEPIQPLAPGRERRAGQGTGCPGLNGPQGLDAFRATGSHAPVALGATTLLAVATTCGASLRGPVAVALVTTAAVNMALALQDRPARHA